jgi:hypothetical protein
LAGEHWLIAKLFSKELLFLPLEGVTSLAAKFLPIKDKLL